MRNPGFVLVTALSVAALVLILGVSSSFMAQSTLEVASNLRQATEARFAAEGGIDQAAAELSLGWNCAGTQSLSVGGYSLTIRRTALGEGQCAVQSRAVGVGARPSSFTASAVIQAQSRSAALSTVPDPEAAARATAACQQPLGSPSANTQGFNYARQKARYFPTDLGGFTLNYPRAAGSDILIRTQAEANSFFPSGSRVRITGANLRFSPTENIVLSDVTIVVEGFEVRFTRPTGSTAAVTVSDSRLNANRFSFGNLGQYAPALQNSRVFAENNLTLGSTADGLPLIRPGPNTLAARNNAEVAVVAGSAYGHDPVGLAVLACGSITHRSTQNLDGVYRAEGKLIWNGRGRLRGSASAAFLETPQPLSLEGAPELANPDTGDFGSSLIRAVVISRR